MNKHNRLPVNPMRDIPAKIALEYNLEFTKFLIRTFMDLDVETVQELKLSDKELPQLQEILDDGTIEEIKLSMDALVTLKDGREIIVEIQVQHQKFFILRLWGYTFLTASKQFLSMDRKLKVKERYPKIKPIYSLAIIKGKYFDDDRPHRTFSLRDIETNQELQVVNEELNLPQDLMRMTIVEVDKYNPAALNNDQRFLFEFFLNMDYSAENIPSILATTDALLKDRKQWKEKDAMKWENEIQLIDEGFEKGIEEGIEKGRQTGRKEGAIETALNLIKNLGLSPEVVAENVGISIEEAMEIAKSL